MEQKGAAGARDKNRLLSGNRQFQKHEGLYDVVIQVENALGNIEKAE